MARLRIILFDLGIFIGSAFFFRVFSIIYFRKKGLIQEGCGGDFGRWQLPIGGQRIESKPVCSWPLFLHSLWAPLASVSGLIFLAVTSTMLFPVFPPHLSLLMLCMGLDFEELLIVP